MSDASLSQGPIVTSFALPTSWASSDLNLVEYFSIGNPRTEPEHIPFKEPFKLGSDESVYIISESVVRALDVTGFPVHYNFITTNPQPENAGYVFSYTITTEKKVQRRFRENMKAFVPPALHEHFTVGPVTATTVYYFLPLLNYLPKPERQALRTLAADGYYDDVAFQVTEQLATARGWNVSDLMTEAAKKKTAFSMLRPY